MLSKPETPQNPSLLKAIFDLGRLNMKTFMWAMLIVIAGIITSFILISVAWWLPLLTIPLSFGAGILFYMFGHLIFKRWSVFVGTLETESRDKGFTTFVKDMDMASSDEFSVKADPKEVAAIKKHHQGYKLGVPVLSREATDYVLGKREVMKTLFGQPEPTPMIGYVGEIGSGKTMAMKEAAVKFRALGYRILANDEGLGADYVFESLEELCAIIDLSVRELYIAGKPPETYTFIMFDEIQNTFDSRHFAKFDSAVWARLTQRRKFGFVSHWTAPKEEYVERRIRQMTHWVWHCSKTPILKRHKRAAYPPLDETAAAPERPKSVQKTWMREKVRKSYNTFAFVNSFSKDGPSVKDQIIGRGVSKEEFDKRKKEIAKNLTDRLE